MITELTLYADATFTSPYAMSVFVALTEKGLPFEIKTVNLDANDNKAAAYARVSLTERVPTLAHGAFHLSESSAITEYLDEVLPAPEYRSVYPGEKQARARARQVQAWIRSDLLPIREERPTSTIFFNSRVGRPLSEQGTAAAAKLVAAADELVGADAGHMFGDWCIADTDLAVMLMRLIANGDSMPSKLRLYAERQWQREAVRGWVAQPRPVA
ncbi:MAG TPA: glutathione transferase [Hyphomicrobiaceae bacterium]|nr:glutathione transferase [Hyphomicrobiaceae bacterium]